MDQRPECEAQMSKTARDKYWQYSTWYRYKKYFLNKNPFAKEIVTNISAYSQSEK